MNDIYVAVKISGRDAWLFGQSRSLTFDHSVTVCTLPKAKRFKTVEQSYRWANRHICTGPRSVFEKVVCCPADRFEINGVKLLAHQK